MRAVDGHLIVAGRGIDLSRSSLQSFDANTGELRWKIDDLPMESAINADRDRVYLAVQYQLRAYDIEDGSLLWKSEQIPTNKIYRLDIEDGKVVVDSAEDRLNKREQVIRLFDAESGEVIRSDHFEIQPETKLLCNPLTKDYWAGTEGLLAENKVSNQLLWQAKMKMPTFCLPNQTSSTIVLSGRGFADIYAIDDVSGQTVWIYPERIISNVVLVLQRNIGSC